MSNSIEERLQAEGIILPTPSPVAGNYVPFVQTQNMIFVSGQLPFVDGKLAVTGKLGANVTIEQGQYTARLCAINLLAQLRAACGGDLRRVHRVVKLGGFVACTADFTDQPKIINGASDLMVAVFGPEIGAHARFAVGAPALPLDAAVEVEGIFEID